MPIQAKIIENPSKSSDFPKLMRRKKNGDVTKETQYIVLFLTLRNGIVVSNNGAERHPFCQIIDTWNFEAFEEFNGEVVLKNE